MNIKKRLELRALINIVISVIERLASLLDKAQKNFYPKPKTPTPDVTVKPHRPRPLKKVVDTIDNIVPLPWRNKNE